MDCLSFLLNELMLTKTTFDHSYGRIVNNFVVDRQGTQNFPSLSKTKKFYLSSYLGLSLSLPLLPYSLNTPIGNRVLL